MSEIYIFLLKIEVVHIDFYLWAKKKGVTLDSNLC